MESKSSCRRITSVLIFVLASVMVDHYCLTTVEAHGKTTQESCAMGGLECEPWNFQENGGCCSGYYCPSSLVPGVDDKGGMSGVCLPCKNKAGEPCNHFNPESSCCEGLKCASNDEQAGQAYTCVETRNDCLVKNEFCQAAGTGKKCCPDTFCSPISLTCRQCVQEHSTDTLCFTSIPESCCSGFHCYPTTESGDRGTCRPINQKGGESILNISGKSVQ